MNKLKNLIFLLIIFSTPLTLIFSQKSEISNFENRTLATIPNISKSTVLDRNFIIGFEDYISDHFPNRDAFLVINIKKDFALNKPMINDIIISNDVLLPYFSGFDTTYSNENFDKMATTLKNFNEFCNENEIEFLYVGIPEQSSAFKLYYPEYFNNSMYVSSNLSSDFFNMLSDNSIDFINMSQIFSDNPYKYYSSTDHHFNFFGAYETYLGIANFINNNYFKIDIFDNILVKESNINFLGSRNRKLFGLFDTNDKLYDYDLSIFSDINFTRYDNKTLVESTVFDSSNSTYNYYMGGDKAETIISTNRDELKDLLIIGDSFTNPIETLIYTAFNETRSLDLRYNTEIDLRNYIIDFSPDVIIYIRDDISFINNDGNGNLNI